MIDPADDGAAVSFAVIDRVRSEFLHPYRACRPAASRAEF
jgi:hypothetical protein